jgi:2-polyprenyl-3-methyl-5-hydroxy-6-metoxy-1,4-benzoquinol methylase
MNLANNKCFLCKTDQDFIFNRMGYEYHRCPKCELVSTYPFPGVDEIESHYKDKFLNGNYQLIQEHMQSYLGVYQGFANRLMKSLKDRNQQTIDGKKVLDIGCFTGDFLKILKDLGADPYGIELQNEAVEIANKSLNGQVYNADLLGFEFPQIEYDVVTMLGLIEHVVQPLELIKRAASLLKKKGLFMIQTPDSASVLAKVMNKHWPPYAPVEHIHLFSKQSLKKVLQELGFTSIKFYPHVKMLPVNYVYKT